MTTREPSGPMYCGGCGYNLHSLAAGECPECGKPFDPDNPATYAHAPRRPVVQFIVGMALVLAAVAWGSTASEWTDFVDLPILLFVLLLITGGMWASFGPKQTFAAISDAARRPHAIDGRRCREHLIVLARGYQLAWGAGLLATVMSVIMMLQSMNDPSVIGTGVAVSIIGAYYGAIIAELFFGVLQYRLARTQAAAAEGLSGVAGPHRWMIALAFAVMFVVLTLFFANFLALSELKK